MDHSPDFPGVSFNDYPTAYSCTRKGTTYKGIKE